MSAIIGIAALGSFTFHYVSINTIVRAVIAYAAVALYIPLYFY